MPRKHLFPLVVLLAAAAVAGLLALGRAVDVGQPAGASTGEQPAIAFRLAELDRAERSLRQQLADLRRAPASETQTVYQRAATQTDAEHEDDHDDDHEDEDDHEDDDYHEDGERDD